MKNIKQNIQSLIQDDKEQTVTNITKYIYDIMKLNPIYLEIQSIVDDFQFIRIKDILDPVFNSNLQLIEHNQQLTEDNKALKNDLKYLQDIIKQINEANSMNDILSLLSIIAKKPRNEWNGEYKMLKEFIEEIKDK